MTHQSHNNPERDDVADLMKDAFACEPMRDEFATALQAMLQSEFTNRYSGRSISSESAASLAAMASAGSPTSADSTERGTGRRPIRHRLFFGSLIASVVACVFLLSGSRSNYTWASMLQALESRPWIQATGETTTGRENSGWISYVHRIVAHRSPQRTELVDHRHQVRDRYEPSENVIHRESLTNKPPGSAGDLFVGILLGELPGRDVPEVPSTDATDAASLEILDESWRRVSDEHGDLVELTVRVRYSHREFDLVFHVNPKTSLPLSCRVDDLNGSPVASYHMDYPPDGPRDVVQMGVPKSAPVVALSPADNSAALAKNIPSIIPSDIPSTDVNQPTEPALSLDSLQAPDPKSAASQPVEETKSQIPSTPPAVVQDAPAVDVVGQPLRDTIDALLADFWRKNGVKIAPPADDFEFLRRVYLDLTGRIPTVAEIQNYVGDDANRRENLLSQLLESNDCASHLASVWRQMLMPPDVDLSRLGGTENFEKWLSERFRSNVPYDQLVRDLLLAEGRIGEAGPLLFYAAVQLDPERLASQTSRVFLGIRMECAQCHDHKFDERIKQQDFWGYAAFFGQISRPRGKMEMASPVLRVRDSQHGEVMIPDTKTVVKPKFPFGPPAAEDSNSLSRRRQLADWITSPDNPYFARATVNRVWAHFWGKGITEPVDDMRPDSSCVSPQLLDITSRAFIASGFDLRELIRSILQTRAYQLTSRSQDDDPSSTAMFAQMNIKSFTGEQLFDSIALATQVDKVNSSRNSNEFAFQRFAGPRQLFLSQFQTLPGRATEYQAGIPQALALMNGQLVQNATQPQTRGLLRSFEAPFFTNRQRLETLFLATLSRMPTPSEVDAMLPHIDGTSSKEELTNALSDVLWALLNCAEFTLNH